MLVKMLEDFSFEHFVNCVKQWYWAIISRSTVIVCFLCLVYIQIHSAWPVGITVYTDINNTNNKKSSRVKLLLPEMDNLHSINQMCFHVPINPNSSRKRSYKHIIYVEFPGDNFVTPVAMLDRMYPYYYYYYPYYYYYK